MARDTPKQLYRLRDGFIVARHQVPASMTTGPGKYDTELTAARLSTGGQIVALIVFGGRRGAGWGTQFVPPTATPQAKRRWLIEAMKEMASMCRQIANQYDADAKRMEEAGV